jgi:hypothetical protein
MAIHFNKSANQNPSQDPYPQKSQTRAHNHHINYQTQQLKQFHSPYLIKGTHGFLFCTQRPEINQ